MGLFCEEAEGKAPSELEKKKPRLGFQKSAQADRVFSSLTGILVKPS